MHPARILIVDDDEGTCRTLAMILRREGYHCETAQTAREALEKAGRGSLDVAILDILLPDRPGMDLLTPLREKHPDIALILVTGYASLQSAVQALEAGAAGYLTKPIQVDELLAKVRNTLEHQRLLRENRRLYQEVQRELAERRRAEEERRRLFEGIPIGVYRMTPEGQFLEANTALVEILGYPDRESLLQGNFWEHVPAPERARWQADLTQAGAAHDLETQLRCHDGRTIWGRLNLQRVQDFQGNVYDEGSLEDCTAHREAEEALREKERELIQQERLAAVGQLAAGIAHDFNNILQGILTFAELLRGRPDMPTEAREQLNLICQLAERAARMVRQILDFSRQSTIRRVQVDLTALLAETTQLLRRILPESIEVHYRQENPACWVQADPAQLQQALLNLAANARDAMPEGGHLTLRLTCIALAEDTPRPVPGMEAGIWARIEVTDTGTGIAPEVLPHIFEPFFTTKEWGAGTGTGLGLSQVYGIIQQHNGHIGVETEMGKGTTFTLYLPLLPIEESLPEEELVTLVRGKGELVLLVEDEPTVRQALQGVLEELNYRVLGAANGEEAIRLYDRSTDPVALVLTDVVMPRSGGKALIEALVERKADVPVVLMTGHSPEDLPERLADRVAGRLEKPVRATALAQLVGQILGTKGGG